MTQYKKLSGKNKFHSISSLFFQPAQKRHTMISVKAEQCETSLCILWMKPRSNAHQVSFIHTPISYFNSKANGDKKSASKNKPKKNTRHRVTNIVVTCCCCKKKHHIQVQKTMNTLLHAVSHKYVIVSLLIIQQ